MDRRKLLGAAAAIVVFGAASFLLAYLVTRTPDRPGGAPGAPAPPADVGPPVEAPRVRDTRFFPPGASSVEPPPPPVIAGPPPPPPPPPDSWEAITPAPRMSALGPVGGALGRGLNDIRDTVTACFDEDTQARHGTQAVSETRDYAALDDHGTTILMLEVVASAGEVRIVDAPVETRGGASDGLIACAQRVLRGQRFPATGATAPGRYRVLYTLTP